MSRVSREELADRAGVGSAWVERLVDLGILRPADDGSFSSGDIRRARLLDDLERAGLPLGGMAEVLERGELSLASFDLPVYERFSLMSGTTFREASERHDVPLDLLMVVREAIGSAEPGPDDLVREDELRILPLIELQIARGLKTLTHRRARSSATAFAQERTGATVAQEPGREVGYMSRNRCGIEVQSRT